MRLVQLLSPLRFALKMPAVVTDKTSALRCGTGHINPKKHSNMNAKCLHIIYLPKISTFEKLIALHILITSSLVVCSLYAYFRYTSLQ